MANVKKHDFQRVSHFLAFLLLCSLLASTVSVGRGNGKIILLSIIRIGRLDSLLPPTHVVVLIRIQDNGSEKLLSRSNFNVLEPSTVALICHIFAA